MQKLRHGIVVLCMLMCLVTTASAQVNIGIGIGLPNVSIGINLPLFPDLVPLPGYPVYYAPQVEANYFFYDGMYWVYQDDNWYASNWYNGPWSYVEPVTVPLYILRIPVRYYRHPPAYFRGWRSDAPPRWGHHWGRDWEHQRKGWDKWKRSSSPARAPLPVYQRQYTGDRYPRQVEHQQELRREHYRYQPRDKAVQQHFQQRKEQRAPAPARRERQEEPRLRGSAPQEVQRPAPHQQQVPDIQRPQPQPRGPAYQEQRPEQRREQRQEPRYEQRQEQRREQKQEQRYQEREKQPEPRGQEQRRDEGRGRGRDN